jgi:hypothetical protein
MVPLGDLRYLGIPGQKAPGRLIDMRILAYTFVLTSLLTGCNQIQLRQNAGVQAAIGRDLEVQQVLDNLAMFCANPSAVPFYSFPDSGTPLIESSGAIAGTFNFASTGFTSLGFSGMGGTPLIQRKANASWVLRPINNAYAIRRMRAVYQIAVGRTDLIDVSTMQNLLLALKTDSLDPVRLPPPGWYQCGCRSEVPKHVKLVGCYETTYVWVLPEGEDSLVHLTLTVLDLSLPFTTPAGPIGATPGNLANPTSEGLKKYIKQLRESNAPEAQDHLKQLFEAMNEAHQRHRALLTPPTEQQVPLMLPFNPALGTIPAYGR